MWLFSADGYVHSSLSQLCVLKSDISHSLVYVFYPEKFKCLEVTCCEDLTKLQVEEEIAFNLLTRTCKKRQTATKKSKLAHSRTPLIDEYRLKLPFLWKLKCPHELKQVIKYFKKKVSELGIMPTPDVPLLISLDYGINDTSNLCKTHIEELSHSAQGQEVTDDEALFLQEYFYICTNKEAYSFFTLCHRMQIQIKRIREITKNKGNSLLYEFGYFVKKSIKDLGIAEVLYRLFLLELIYLLSKTSSLSISKTFKQWVIKGAGRDCPASNSSSEQEKIASETSSRIPQAHYQKYDDLSSEPPIPQRRTSLPVAIQRTNRLPPCMRKKRRK